MDPYVSIIIPTYRRPNDLLLCLESINKLEGSIPFEVLIIDNDPKTNFAPKFLNSFSHLNLYVFKESSPGLHNARHKGMENAKGEVLAFLDDDVEVTSKWLQSIVEVFRDPDVMMLSGNNLPKFLINPPKWITELWEFSNLRGYKSIPSLSILEYTRPIYATSPFLVWGCNFIVRKKVLEISHGFNPDSLPHEYLRFRGDGETHVSNVVSNNKMKCIHHPGATVYHKVDNARMTLDYFYRRGFNQGISKSFSDYRNKKNSFISLEIILGLSYKLKQFLKFGSYSVETRKVNLAYKKGFIEGLNFHKKQYEKNPKIRDWVNKKDYLSNSNPIDFS